MLILHLFMILSDPEPETEKPKKPISGGGTLANKLL